MAGRLNVVPPLKWAGGKRWFANRYMHLLPAGFNMYIEPFAGSAALFFSVQPKKALLSDSNSELINLYAVIKSSPKALEEELSHHQRLHDKEYFYEIRASEPVSNISKASRFLYLNRTCWNGLYRVNLAGKFNVPIGTKNNVVMETDNFCGLSEVLQGTELLCSDFESVIDRAGADDFVFIDPPYTVAHNHNGFIKYNEALFSWADQVRLKEAIVRATRKGTKVLITNAAHDSVRELYDGFETVTVNRAGVIAAKSAARGKYEELIIKNYE